MDRRRFLIGLAATSTAVAVPLGAFQASALTAPEIPEFRRKILDTFISEWDELSRYYDWGWMKNVKLVELISFDPKYDKLRLTNLDHYDDMRRFAVDVEKVLLIDPNDQFITVNCGFFDLEKHERVWYTVTLERKECEDRRLPMANRPDVDNSQIQKYVDYVTNLAEGNNENVKKIFWDK